MFIVIKYFEKFRLSVPGIPDAFPKWGKVDVSKHKIKGVQFEMLRLKSISRDEARKLIKEHGLVETLRDGSGIVYDTPDLAFQRKYKGFHVPGNLAD